MTAHPSRPFYFLRHGQTDWNLEGRIQGHTDIPLNPTGLVQAHAAASRLAGAGITRIISSPLVRALKTAAITAEGIQLPVHIDSRLMERTFGSFEGRLREDIMAEQNIDPTSDILYTLPEDAEDWPTTMERARSSIAHWLETCPDDTILFVGHGAFFRALYESLTGEYRESPNAIPFHLSPTANGWQMRTL